MALAVSIFQKVLVYTCCNSSSIVDCTCDIKGSEGGKCAHRPNGECRCKPAVKGFRCEQCIDGYYGLGKDDRIGCKSCNYECSADGTFGEVCDKIHGTCTCKRGWWGDACDRKCQQCDGRTCDQARASEYMHLKILWYHFYHDIDHNDHPIYLSVLEIWVFLNQVYFKREKKIKLWRTWFLF